jgi:hypothetical protein
MESALEQKRQFQHDQELQEQQQEFQAIQQARALQAQREADLARAREMQALLDAAKQPALPQPDAQEPNSGIYVIEPYVPPTAPPNQQPAKPPEPVIDVPSNCADAEQRVLSWVFFNKCKYAVFWTAECNPVAKLCFVRTIVEIGPNETTSRSYDFPVVVNGPYRS